jgi:putative Ca2+/H+ antiporter (TMEM165/GDT1 family)
MLKIVLSTFVLVFLAELGDKTQLAVFNLAIESRSPWAVFLGAGSALLFSTAIAVGLGTIAVRVIPPGFTRLLHYVAGALFILVGVWTIWKA